MELLKFWLVGVRWARWSEIRSDFYSNQSKNQSEGPNSELDSGFYSNQSKNQSEGPNSEFDSDFYSNQSKNQSEELSTPCFTLCFV